MTELSPTPYAVRILDLSGGAEEGVVEEVTGFPSLLQANEFARRYVRDSLELCRAPGASGEAVLEGWRAFGEDALALPEGGEAWRAGPGDLAAFAAIPASRAERDWRALDPRKSPRLAEGRA